jgi:predicted dehydrogenase
MNGQNMSITRRSLLQAAPLVVPATALGRAGAVAPSDRINIGIIGVNGMGRGNLANCARHADVAITAICDVSTERRDAALALHKDTAKGYRDYRELLAQPGIDGVIIAPPPHWHALMAIEAVKAGKDIYLQKPMTLYPDETIAVRNAVRRHKRISQVGTQIHAGANYRRVVEWIRSGKLGPVSTVRTFNVMNQGPTGIGRAPKQDPPPGLDWDMWLGPGPSRPFNSLLYADSYNHCSFWDYTRGWTPGMAPHIIDLPIWALNLDVPDVTTCTGGRDVIDDDGDAPDVQEITWRYKKFTMTWSMNCANSFAYDFGRGKPARRLGIYFHALNGTLFTDYSNHTIVAEGDLLKDPAPPPQTIAPSPGHERQWLDSIKSRVQPDCCVDYHYKVDLAITLAGIAYQLGRSVRWDPVKERIAGDKEAQRLARPVYRRPWKFPSEYL